MLASSPQEYCRIEVTDPVSGREYTLEYLPPHTAHKALGHHKEPAGTEQAQFLQLQKKSTLPSSYGQRHCLGQKPGCIIMHVISRQFVTH